MTTENATAPVATVTVTLTREAKPRKVRDKELLIGVWYEKNAEQKTAFVARVLDDNDNVMFEKRVECAEYTETDEETNLKFDPKALKAAKGEASKFANAYGEEPNERENVVADLKRLVSELRAEFSDEKLIQVYHLIEEKLAA
jgi:predicted phage tail protein